MQHGGKSENEAFTIAEGIWQNHADQNIKYGSNTNSQVRVTGAGAGGLSVAQPPPLEVAQARSSMGAGPPPQLNNQQQFSTQSTEGSSSAVGMDLSPISTKLEAAFKRDNIYQDKVIQRLDKLGETFTKVQDEISTIRSKGYNIRRIGKTNVAPRPTDYWKTKSDQGEQKPYRFLTKGKLGSMGGGLLGGGIMAMAQQFPTLGKLLKTVDTIMNPVQAVREKAGGITKGFTDKMTDILFSNQKRMLEDPDFLFEKADIDKLDEGELKQKVIGELIPEKLAELTDYDKQKINLLSNIWNVNKEQLKLMGGGGSPATQLQQFVDTSAEKYDVVTGKYLKEDDYGALVEERNKALKETAQKLASQDLANSFGVNELIADKLGTFQKNLTGTNPFEEMNPDNIVDIHQSLLRNKHSTERAIRHANEAKLKQERQLYGYDAYTRPTDEADELDEMNWNAKEKFIDEGDFVGGIKYLFQPGKGLESIRPDYKKIISEKDNKLRFSGSDFMDTATPVSQMSDFMTSGFERTDVMKVFVTNERVPVEIFETPTVEQSGFNVTPEQASRMVDEENLPTSHSGGPAKGIPWYHRGMVRGMSGRDNVVSMLQEGEYVMTKQETKSMASRLGSIDENIKLMTESVADRSPVDVQPSALSSKMAEFKDDDKHSSTQESGYERKIEKKQKEETDFRKTNIAVLKKIDEKLDKGFKGLKKGLKKAGSDKKGFFGKLLSGLGGLLGKVAPIIGGLLAGLGAIASGILPALMALMISSSDKWRSVTQMASSLLGGLGILKKGKQGADAIDAAGDAANAAKASKPGLMGRMWGGIKQAGSWVGQQARSLGTAISESRVGRTVSSGMQWIANSQVGRAVGSAARGVRDFAVNAWNFVSGAVTKFAKSVKGTIDKIKGFYTALKGAGNSNIFVRALKKVCSYIGKFFVACVNTKFVKAIFGAVGILSAVIAFIKLVDEWDDSDILQIILRVGEIIGSIVSIPGVAITLGSFTFGILPAILTGIGLLCGIWADRRRAEMENEASQGALSEDEIQRIESQTQEVERQAQSGDLNQIVPQDQLQAIAEQANPEGATASGSNAPPPMMHSGGRIGSKKRPGMMHSGGRIAGTSGSENIEITAQEDEYLLTKMETKSIVDYLKGIYKHVKDINEILNGQYGSSSFNTMFGFGNNQQSTQSAQSRQPSMLESFSTGLRSLTSAARVGVTTGVSALRSGDSLTSSISQGFDAGKRTYEGFTQDDQARALTGDENVTWPADSMVVNSPFGDRSKYISNGGSSFHKGMDIRGSIGDPVYAVMGGVVKRVGGADGVLEIEHEDGITTRYIHLSAFNVRKGDRVNAGDVVGAIGNKTASVRNMAPHLHFEVKKAGRAIDPHKFFTENLSASVYQPQWNFPDAQARVQNYGPPPQQMLAQAPEDGESSGAAASDFSAGRPGTTGTDFKSIISQGKKLQESTGGLLAQAEKLMGSETADEYALSPLERSIMALTESIQGLAKTIGGKVGSGDNLGRLNDIEQGVQEVSSTRDQAQKVKDQQLARESAPNVQAPPPQQVPMMVNTEGDPAAMAAKQTRQIDHVTEHMIDSIFANTTISFSKAVTNFALGQTPFTSFR